MGTAYVIALGFLQGGIQSYWCRDGWTDWLYQAMKFKTLEEAEQAARNIASFKRSPCAAIEVPYQW